MNARQAIRLSIDSANLICQGYLGDLTDAELLVRPVPGANHTAWSLGHLLVSERDMIETTCPGSMPSLPAGFAEKYTRETSKLDSQASFHPKAVYMDLFEQQRSATLKALDKLRQSFPDQTRGVRHESAETPEDLIQLTDDAIGFELE